MKNKIGLDKVLSVVLKIVVVLLVMFAFAFISFEGVSKYLTGEFYDVKKLFAEEPGDKHREDDEVQEEPEEKDLDGSILFVQNPDGTGHYMFLNLVDKKSKAFTMLLIPDDSYVEVSSDILDDMQDYIPDAESLVKISDIMRNFGEDKYETVCDIFAELLDRDISTYYAMSADDFVSFLKLAGKVSFNFDKKMSFRGLDGQLIAHEKGESFVGAEEGFALMSMLDGTEGQENARLARENTYITNVLSSMLSKRKSTEIAKKFLKLSQTNTDKDNKELESVIKKMRSIDPVIRILQGSLFEEKFVIDSDKARLQISALIKQERGEIKEAVPDTTEYEDEDIDDTEGGNETDVTEDTDSAGADNVSSSKGCNIEIYNAARIAGIAGAWSDYLSSEGYTITAVDNYQQEGILETTRILVPKEGMGEDLKTYFPNAVIQLADVDTAGAIRILIGSDSASVGTY